ncbi:MAG: DinB family protein [Actinomycetota bacterium]
MSADAARPEPPDIPLVGDETTLLIDFLDYYRAALVDRAWGLSDEQLRYRHPPSRLSIGALVGHMVMVESNWFRNRFDGEGMAEPWASLDFSDDYDAEMTHSESRTSTELVALFNEAVEDSRRRTAAADSLDQLSIGANPDGEHWNLRWILIHMIEEYARHCGHADLIREAIDGDTAD